MSNLSPDPGVPQTPTKALVSTVLTAIVAFGLYYVGDDDPFTKKEIVEGIIYSLVGSGLVGGATFFTKNKRTV